MSHIDFKKAAAKVQEDEKWAQKYKTMLYLNELLYRQFKARCDKRGVTVSAMVEEWMKACVEAEQDTALDRKVREAILPRQKGSNR
jgi:hypothetical protein